MMNLVSAGASKAVRTAGWLTFAACAGSLLACTGDKGTPVEP